MVMNGVPLSVLKKLRGHSDIKMTERYAVFEDSAASATAPAASTANTRRDIMNFPSGTRALPIAISLTIGIAALESNAQAQPAMIASEKIGRYEDLGTLPAELQAPTYRNMDKLYPVRVINRGSSVSPLPEGKPVQVTYRVGDETFGINEFMMRNNTAGLLAIKDGQVVLERYAMGNDAQTKWLSFSVAKSIASTLVGAAVKDGSSYTAWTTASPHT